MYSPSLCLDQFKANKIDNLIDVILEGVPLHITVRHALRPSHQHHAQKPCMSLHIPHVVLTRLQLLYQTFALP
jgi:hypothetical protein